MKSFLRTLKKSCYLQGILTSLFGLLLLIFPKGSLQFACMALGIILIATGAVNLIGYFAASDRTFFQSNLFSGVLFLCLGIWLLVNPKFFLSFFPVILGVVIMLHGAFDLQEAFRLKKMGYARWWIALCISIVTTVLGVVIVCNPYGTTVVVTMVFGGALLLDGGSDIWIATRVSRASKKLKDPVVMTHGEEVSDD